MALSAFDDRSAPPTERSLAVALGASLVHWRALIAFASERYAPLVVKWGFTSASTGWGLRLQRAGRVLLYMTPREGHFLASTALGEKAAAAARARRVPKTLLAVIDAAPRYAEGRGVRFEVKRTTDRRCVEALLELKTDGRGAAPAR